jgi:hypothetical protein
MDSSRLSPLGTEVLSAHQELGPVTISLIVILYSGSAEVPFAFGTVDVCILAHILIVVSDSSTKARGGVPHL